jgi:lysophospholipase L1-like esterase
MSRRILVAAALALAVLAVPATANARTHRSYYVSLGDSWAQGDQPFGPNQSDVPTNQGFTDYLYPKARKVFPGLKLAKLGCGGATTTSMINGGKRCKLEHLPYTSADRASSQLTYAARFIRQRRGKVALITVVIGGNDFASCISKSDMAEALTCVTNGIATMKANLPTIAKTLRRAAGKKTVIVGETYANIGLAGFVRGGSTGMQLAQASVPVFRQQISPAIKSAYAKQDIGFVDATKDFGGYIPLSQTTTLAPYGQIPVAVADICTFSWACEAGPTGIDIHLKAVGYRKLAGFYLAEIKKRL